MVFAFFGKQLVSPNNNISKSVTSANERVNKGITLVIAVVAVYDAINFIIISATLPIINEIKTVQN